MRPNQRQLRYSQLPLTRYWRVPLSHYRARENSLLLYNSAVHSLNHHQQTLRQWFLPVSVQDHRSPLPEPSRHNGPIKFHSGHNRLIAIIYPPSKVPTHCRRFGPHPDPVPVEVVDSLFADPVLLRILSHTRRPPVVVAATATTLRPLSNTLRTFLFHQSAYVRWLVGRSDGWFPIPSLPRAEICCTCSPLRMQFGRGTFDFCLSHALLSTVPTLVVVAVARVTHWSLVTLFRAEDEHFDPCCF